MDMAKVISDLNEISSSQPFQNFASSSFTDVKNTNPSSSSASANTPVSVPLGIEPPTEAVKKLLDDIIKEREERSKHIDCKEASLDLAEKLALEDPCKGPRQIWTEVYRAFRAKYHGRREGFELAEEKSIITRVKTVKDQAFRKTSGFLENLENPEFMYFENSNRVFVHSTHTFKNKDPKSDDFFDRLVVLGHDRLFRLLADARNLFADGTFSCVPLPFYQMIVVMVHSKAYDLYVPVAYVLMTNKTQQMYMEVFHQVMKLSGYKLKPDHVSSDFEKGLINTLKFYFCDGTKPGDHRGCKFHFKQAIRKFFVERTSLTKDEVKILLGEIDLLTIIDPKEIISKGFPYIFHSCGYSASCKVIQDFLRYFNRQWMPIVESWNVYDYLSKMKYREDVETLKNRTNNPVERYNRRLNEIFPESSKPSPIAFIKEMKKEIMFWVLRLEALDQMNATQKNTADAKIEEVPDDYPNFKPPEKLADDVKSMFSKKYL